MVGQRFDEGDSICDEFVSSRFLTDESATLLADEDSDRA